MTNGRQLGEARLGVMADAAARQKVTRLALRVQADEVHLEALPGGGARLRFALARCKVDRTHARLGTEAENMTALARWFEDRVRSVERGVDSVEEAFADCLAERADHPTVRPPAATGYAGGMGVEACIDVFRRALATLGVPERDVKVTWDAVNHWARLRMALPSGRTVDKTVRAEDRMQDVVVSLAMLALWLRGRAHGWEVGWEAESLDDVFAGALVPAAAPAAGGAR